MNKAACKIILVISFNLLGVVLLIIGQNASTIVKSSAGRRAVLVAGSFAAKTFAEPSVPAHRAFYFFNLKNKDEVMEGANPIVEELGPYVFRMKLEKEMKWEGNKIIYRPKRTYFFEPSESDGNLSDVITTLNPGAVTAARFEPALVPSLFDTATVGQFLFEGIPSSTNSSDDEFAYFKGKNGSIEGTFEAFTGEGGNIEDLNRIISFNGRTALDCEDFRGTNGERFPPFSDPPAKLTLYNPLLCRPWDLHYNGVVDINGLNCVRYSHRRDFFSRTLNESMDACFEAKSNGKDVGIQGVLNSQNCQNTFAPILYSLPHFLDADPQLRQNLTGLRPFDEKHSFYVDVYPPLGVVLNPRIRVQVNFRLKRVGEFLRESKMQEIIYPVFWQEMMLLKRNSEKAAALVFRRVELPGQVIFWTFLCLGVFFITAAAVVLLSGLCLQWLSDVHAAASDAYASYDPRSDNSRVRHPATQHRNFLELSSSSNR